jgi:hypothetical protein
MVDNKACIAITQDTNSKGWYKHIDTRYKFIQEEEINNNNIILEYINTENMLADPLTKRNSHGINERRRENIGVSSLPLIKINSHWI